YIEVHNSNHNHNLLKDLLGHLMLHQLTKHKLVRVTEITTSDSHSMEIILTIYQNDLSALAISKVIIMHISSFAKEIWQIIP
ncbi:3173_t:CDS:1, partial [Cetraspora pellucida]